MPQAAKWVSPHDDAKAQPGLVSLHSAFLLCNSTLVYCCSLFPVAIHSMRSHVYRSLISPLRPQIIPLRLTPSFPARSLSSSAKHPRPQAGPKTIRTVSTIPFIGAFFSSNRKTENSSEAMSYPDQRSEDQWRTVLNPGSYHPTHDARSVPHIRVYTNFEQ